MKTNHPAPAPDEVRTVAYGVQYGLVEMTSLAEARHKLALTYGPHGLDTSDTNFHCRQRRLNIFDMSINDLHYASKVRILATIEGYYCLMFPLRGMQHLELAGKRYELKEGYGLMLQPGIPMRQQLSRDHHMLSITISTQAFKNYLRRELGSSGNQYLRFASAPVPVAGRFCSAFRYIQFLMGADIAENDVFDTRLGRLAEQMLIALLLGAIPNNYQDLTSHKAARTEIIAKAESFIAEHLTDEIDTEDIAAAAHVTAGGLYYAFEKYYGATPLQVVKVQRLKMAKEMLRNAGARDTTVAAVASACGFNHLSKFARDYKRQFGELPRTTLKRAV